MNAKPKKKPVPPAKPSPRPKSVPRGTLGSGMAERGAEAIRKRRKTLEGI